MVDAQEGWETLTDAELEALPDAATTEPVPPPPQDAAVSVVERPEDGDTLPMPPVTDQVTVAEMAWPQASRGVAVKP